MKTKNLMFVVIAGAMTFMVTSCQKEEQFESVHQISNHAINVDWKKEMNDYVLTVQSNPGIKSNSSVTTQGIKLNWGLMAADFTTGIEWGILGFEYTGNPQIALGTALAGSILGSLAHGRIAPTNLDHPFSQNPKTIYGEMHNNVCLDFVNVDEYYINDTTLSDAGIQYVKKQVSEQLGIQFEEMSEFSDCNQWSLQCRNDFREENYSRSIKDEDTKFFVDKFLSNINPDFDHDEFLEYVKNFEKIIINSDLPEFKKDLFLSHLSIASHSSYLW